MSTQLLLGLSLSFAFFGTSAEADRSNPKVAVLPVQYEGELEEHWKTQLVERLTEGLARGRFELLGADVVSREIGEGERCDTADCYGRVGRAFDAAYLIRARIVAVERDYEVKIDVIDPADGRITASTTEQCSLCGVSEAGEMAASQAAVLRRKLDDLVLGPPVFVVESTPPGALVYIDGELVGMTPTERVVTPGDHVIRAAKDGHVAQERAVTAVTGVRENLSFPLEPMPKDRRSRVRRWGWALLGGGGVALVSGVVLLAIDERPYRGRCTGADIDAFGNCRFSYNTLTGGIVATVTGVLAASTGVGLLIATRSARREPAANVQLRIVPQSGGAALTGRF